MRKTIAAGMLLALICGVTASAQTKRRTPPALKPEPPPKYAYLMDQVGSRRAELRLRWKPDAHIGLYTADATLLAPNGRVAEGREAIQKFWRELADRGARTLVLIPFKAESDGDNGHEAGRYEITFAREGAEPVTIKGTYLAGLKRDSEGLWRVGYDSFTAEQPYPQQ